MTTGNRSLITFSSDTRKFIFLGLSAMCLMSFMSPPLALLLGLIFAQIVEHPFPQLNYRATNILLKGSVIGLGFGMDMSTAAHAGRQGFLFTIASIAGVLTTGVLLGRWMKIEKKTSFLISAGTAICGGSAIAALSPVIKAEEKQISVALGIVFILNSVALFMFPVIGHYFHLSQSQFGLWCAIAIHDTSSVVGAASKFGALALEVATTVKLARALWIIPVAFGTAYIFKTVRSKVQVPYFIALFILAMLINTYNSLLRPFTADIVAGAKTGLTLSLFLIGTGLSFNKLKAVGLRPFIEGVLLWGLISATALFAVVKFA